MSITAGPPFNSSSDSALAVAYVSAFILVFYVSHRKARSHYIADTHDTIVGDTFPDGRLSPYRSRLGGPRRRR